MPGKGKKLKIIVAVKQVPDTTEVRIDPQTNTLIREGIPNILNPDDAHALEAALCLKDTHGGSVTVLTMGPPQAEDVLQEALAMGADRGVLVTDKAFAGSDTLITAFTLSRAIMKIGKYDVILCGRQAIDGDTAQVGPQIAGFLDIPQITYAEQIAFTRNALTVWRGLEDCRELVRVRLPALVTVTAEMHAPRYPSLYNIQTACSGAHVMLWGAKELNVPAAMLGLHASPTGVKKIFEPERRAKGEMLRGDERQMAKDLLGKLRELQAL